MSKLLDSNHNLSLAELQRTLELCLDLRLKDASLSATNAVRLFNGFYEGLPRLTADLFANTLVISDHDREVASRRDLHQSIAKFYT